MFHGSGGWGALQLVGKYDVLDQSDTAFNNAASPGGCQTTTLWPGVSSAAPGLSPNAIPLCGDMKTWIVGASWWMTDYMRLMAQYSELDLSGYPTVAVLADPELPPHQTNGFDGATMKGFGHAHAS